MINHQLLALIAQVLQSLPHQMAMRPAIGAPGPVAAASRPAPPSATALVSTAPIPAGRVPTHSLTRTVAHGARTSTADHQGRALPRIEPTASSASSAYMSLARRIPAPGIGSHDINWGNMTRGKGAGNFGM